MVYAKSLCYNKGTGIYYCSRANDCEGIEAILLYLDVLIIGAGVVGCALARELSRYELSLAVLERRADVAEGASKANSGIVHAGFDAKPGTLKAKLNVEGAKMYPELCKLLGAPYTQPGALVLGFTQEDTHTLKELYDQGIQNGVPGLKLLSQEEVLALEPNVNPEVSGALLAETSGLTSPYELSFALADHAAQNGAAFYMETEVQNIYRENDTWHVSTSRGTFTASAVINCAGLHSAKLHNMISEKKYTIIPRRGEYYLMDRMAHLPFSRTMFQCPTKMGKGILVSPTVHGNLLLGPSAEDIDDDADTATTAMGLKTVLEKARLTWKNASPRGTITTFSGIRAHETNGDFVLGPVEGAPMAFEALGIESPGLSAAPAIAKMLCSQVISALQAKEKEDYLPSIPRPKPFRAMNLAERAQAVRENPENGSLVCRCEQVTEAEIREAIRRPVGARSIDGVKRRTRAGMGRCQGGFCSPRVLAILSEELGIPYTEVTKCGGESRLLVGTIAEAAQEGNLHD
jgi:glycerol-3-phosphate dehydrogenase